MTKIISFISRKGGTGKTTAAINLACVLHSIGHKVCLLETDTNYTLNTLRKMELHSAKANNEAIFQVFGSSDDTVVNDLKKVQKEHQPDYIIVDSAGKTTDDKIRSLSIESQLVIVPTSLTQNDLLVTFQTIEDLKPAREINKKLKILVLPNRVHSQTKLETIKDALKALDAEISEVKIPAKNAFANFSTILPEKEFLPIAQSIISHI